MSEETVFIAKPGDQAITAQREKVASLLDRGIMVSVVVDLIMLVFAIVDLLFSGWSLVVWLYPTGFVALAVGMYFLIGWIEARPAGAIEVPIHLADELENGIALTARLRTE